MKKGSLIISLSSLLLLTACGEDYITKEAAVEYATSHYTVEKIENSLTSGSLAYSYNIKEAVGSSKANLPILNERNNFNLDKSQLSQRMVTPDMISNNVFLTEFTSRIKLDDFTDCVEGTAEEKYFMDSDALHIEYTIDMANVLKKVMEKPNRQIEPSTNVKGKCTANIVINSYGLIDKQVFEYDFVSGIEEKGKSIVSNILKGSISKTYEYHTK